MLTTRLLILYITSDTNASKYSCRLRSTHLLFAEFEVRTVYYGPRGGWVGGERGSINYSTDRGNEASKTLITSLNWTKRKYFKSNDERFI